MQTQTLPRLAVPVRRFSALDRYFYFAMSLVTIGVVAYGFHFTVNENFLRPSIPRPRMLWVHATVFTAWLAFFLLQSLLVRTRNVRLHRRIGWFGLALGIAVFVVGIATTFVMVPFKRDVLHQTGGEAFMMVPLFDMLCFGSTFALAIHWRKKPEFHRRLVFIATCALTAAGWGRFPAAILPGPFFYAGVDLLIVLGIVRDLLVNRRVHTVYRYALPAFVIGHSFVILTLLRSAHWWQSIAHKLTS